MAVETFYSALHWAAKSEKSAVKASESASKAEQYAQAGGLYGKITNCITEIPQDIKLELNNGTLTLKAGSKVYVPNGKNADGSNKFDEVVIESDVIGLQWGTVTASNISEMYNPVTKDITPWEHLYSGSTAPTQTFCIWYDTTNNLVKWTTDGGASWGSGMALPLSLSNYSNGFITSIDQVFNGFGYIGSTVFALPNVKGLIPNGRNADGSLRNIEVTLDSVVMGTATTAASLHNMLLTSDNIYFDDAIYTPNWQFVYKEEENIIINTGNNVTLKGVLFGKCITDSNGVITSFTPKNAFHAVDYQEVEGIVNNLTKHVVVSVLPVEPEEDVFYYIPE